MTHDDRVILASEVGVLPNLPDSAVKRKSRLEPGRMFLIDFEKQAIIDDQTLKHSIASKNPYSQWIAEYMCSVK